MEKIMEWHDYLPNGYWAARQEECRGCFFADEKKIGKGPCCTYPYGLNIDEDGKCHTRRDKKAEEEWIHSQVTGET